jgi:Flp pilus assembly protein TadD
VAHSNKDDYKAAVADFDEAIRLDPRDADAYQSRGAMHEELGNAAAARADYAKALEILPEHEDARESLARLGN